MQTVIETFIADSDIAPHRLLSLTAQGLVQQASSQRCIGVSGPLSTNADAACATGVLGIFTCETGGEFAAGQVLMADSQGRVIAAQPIGQDQTNHQDSGGDSVDPASSASSDSTSDPADPASTASSESGDDSTDPASTDNAESGGDSADPASTDNAESGGDSADPASTASPESAGDSGGQAATRQNQPTDISTRNSQAGFLWDHLALSLQPSTGEGQLVRILLK